jgi:tricorn protease-like protein
VLSGEKTIIEPNGLLSTSLAVSGSGRWLAYRSRGQLLVASPDGKVVKQIPWEADWRLIAGWLDDERIWISRENEGYMNDDLMLLNPFTGEREEFPAEYPGEVYRFPYMGWGRLDWSIKVYDPTLSKVVFLGGYDILTVWDLNQQDKLLEITGTMSLHGVPVWSPDGKKLLFIGPSELRPKNTDNRDELYMVDTDLTVKRLTSFSDHFEVVHPMHFNWSPDGRYVAFELYVEPNEYPDQYPIRPQGNHRLAILDMETKQITDTCVPVSAFLKPLWLPGGRQIVIDNWLEPPSHTEVYLIDLDKDLAVKIAEDASPVGWLEAEPSTSP